MKIYEMNGYFSTFPTAVGILPTTDEVKYNSELGDINNTNEFNLTNKLSALSDYIESLLIRIALNDIPATDISFKITPDFDIRTVIDDVSAISYPNTEEGIQDFIYFRKKRERKEF